MDVVYSILDPAHDLEAHAQVPVLGAHALYGFPGQTQGHGALTPIKHTHRGEISASRVVIGCLVECNDRVHDRMLQRVRCTYPKRVTPAMRRARSILSASPDSIVLSCSNSVSAALQAVIEEQRRGEHKRR